jgi:hypothetical protein
LGEHTHALPTELGYDPEAIGKQKANGVVLREPLNFLSGRDRTHEPDREVTW